MADLEDLNTGRCGHGCTQFTNIEGVRVRMDIVTIRLFDIILFVKNYLVYGGYELVGGTNWIWLDACEQNIAGDRDWTYTASLPRPLGGLRGATLDNRALMTGESSKHYC